jgi:hypothetical protein
MEGSGRAWRDSGNQEEKFPDRDMNPGLSEYEVRMLTFRSRRSILYKVFYW